MASDTASFRPGLRSVGPESHAVHAQERVAVPRGSASRPEEPPLHSRLQRGQVPRRPVTAIREGQNDGNPNTEGNATWTPFITTFTPQYPDYTPGANGVTAAYMGTLIQFFEGISSISPSRPCRATCHATTRGSLTSCATSSMCGFCRAFTSALLTRPDAIRASRSLTGCSVTSFARSTMAATRTRINRTSADARS
jgi:hypothetical protein